MVVLSRMGAGAPVVGGLFRLLQAWSRRRETEPHAAQGAVAPCCTDCVGLRQQLAASQAEASRLRAADGARTGFIAALGRDMRQPLHAALGFSQLMQRDAAAGLLNPRQAAAAARIEAAASRLLALADAVAEFADDGGSQPRLCLQRLDLRLSLRQVCDGLALQAEAAGVALHCPAPTTGMGVTADPDRLRQILRRLVGDAVRHTAPGGEVRLELRRTGAHVAVLVHDAGIHAAPDRLEALFQPFNSVDPSAPPGAGLSLCAAQRWAENMGGRILVSRRASAGTTFTLRLPAAGPLREAPSTPLAAVYVEDAPASGALMRCMAEAVGGLALHVAPDMKEGLDLIAALLPDLVILDADAPGFDLADARRRLGGDSPDGATPLLILSSAGSRGPAALGETWLSKPLELDAFSAAVREAGEQRAGRSVAAWRPALDLTGVKKA